MRRKRRLPRPTVPVRRLHPRTSATNRARAQGTAIMIAVAVAFIGVFAFALSKPTPRTSTARAQPFAQAAHAEESPSSTKALSYSERHARAFISNEADFICDEASVTDGDTLRCGALRIRLAAIDAPEMPGHCRSGRTCVDGDPYASKANLERLMAGGIVECRQTDTDRYGRIVALCQVGGRDLSCAQVQGGHAIIRYGDLACPAG